MSEPSFVHLFQKFLGNGIAGGIAEDGVGISVGTEDCGLLARGIIGHLGGREDAAAEETSALLRPLYLLTVAETGFVGLFKPQILDKFLGREKRWLLLGLPLLWLFLFVIGLLRYHPEQVF